MSRTIRPHWLMAIPVALVAGACKKDEPPAPSAKETKPAAMATGATDPKKLADADATAAVQRSLKNDPGVEAKGIAVKVTEGIVELTGKVEDLLSKQRAVRIAESVKGVRSVSDRITLEHRDRPDADITGNVKNALLVNAAADSYEIDVTTEKGLVTLTGKVGSYQESQLAERLAEGVKGVRDVRNRIRIDYGAQPVDIEIKRSIESRLRWDMLVNDGLLKVAVEDGKVTLTGAVGSAAERRRATMDAWVKGVKSVDSTGVDVTWWAEDRDLRRNKFTKRSDPAIADAIRDAAAYDPRVSAANLTAKVERGVVTLRGTVESPNAKMAAEQLARRTVGALSVKNELVVTPTKKVPDAELEKRIRTALVYDPYTESFEIAVTAKDGKVTLTGSVDTRFERAEATEVVSGIRGVKDIDNQLTVELDTVVYSYDPYLDPYDPYFEAWRYVPPKPLRGDQQITSEIREEMRWSPFVDEDEVEVSVSGGTATLKGTVDSYGERAAAAENAFEGGAVAVNNQLKVAPLD